MPTSDGMRVVVAGGGIAALETVASLHALAGDRVDVTLLTPDTTFAYRPLSTATPFSLQGQRSRSLEELAGGLGARLVHDALAMVDGARRRVLTHDGDFLPYDALVVAVGARTDHAAAAQTWQRDAQRLSSWAEVIRGIEAGGVGSVAFVVPPGAGWPIDAYELALIASLAAGPAASRPKLVLVTAEDAPLEAFGPAVADAVTAELAHAGVELVTGATAAAAAAGDGVVLELDTGSRLEVDRALFLPAIKGPAVHGAPHDQDGFLPVDEHARVPAADGVYAAGDVTALALKHSTLASAQATAAAESIAAAAGATVDPGGWSPVLYGIVTLPPRFPGPRDSPWVRDGEPAEHCLWWPPGHVAGRHLGPYLASSDRAIHPGLDWHPTGVPVAVDVERSGPDTAEPPSVPSDVAVRRDAISRQLFAVAREGREGERLVHQLERRGREFDEHEQEVVERLRAAGYLRG